MGCATLKLADLLFRSHAVGFMSRAALTYGAANTQVLKGKMIPATVFWLPNKETW